MSSSLSSPKYVLLSHPSSSSSSLSFCFVLYPSALPPFPFHSASLSVLSLPLFLASLSCSFVPGFPCKKKESSYTSDFCQVIYPAHCHFFSFFLFFFLHPTALLPVHLILSFFLCPAPHQYIFLQLGLASYPRPSTPTFPSPANYPRTFYSPLSHTLSFFPVAASLPSFHSLSFLPSSFCQWGSLPHHFLFSASCSDGSPFFHLSVPLRFCFFLFPGLTTAGLSSHDSFLSISLLLCAPPFLSLSQCPVLLFSHSVQFPISAFQFSITHFCCPSLISFSSFLPSPSSLFFSF